MGSTKRDVQKLCRNQRPGFFSRSGPLKLYVAERVLSEGLCNQAGVGRRAKLLYRHLDGLKGLRRMLRLELGSKPERRRSDWPLPDRATPRLQPRFTSIPRAEFALYDV
jgi:hypothetical protein